VTQGFQRWREGAHMHFYLSILLEHLPASVIIFFAFFIVIVKQ
jgi:hypothetical protein